MIHLQPLIGYPKYFGLDNIVKRAIRDKINLEKGGVDGILIENTYDDPHKIFVEPETIACMTRIVNEIVKKTSLPVGLIVLWNDYKAAFSIATITGAKFVRIPVFVDKVRTKFGDIICEPEKIIEFRKKIKAENVSLFTDIQVKHSEMLENKPIQTSAKQSIEKGSDALIVTGKRTGDPPTTEKLQRVRNAAKKFPILVGSGSDTKNISEILEYADGVIVGTALETNGFVDNKKVTSFVKAFHDCI